MKGCNCRSCELWCKEPEIEYLIARASVVAGSIRDMPRIFQNVMNSVKLHYQTIAHNNGICDRALLCDSETSLCPLHTLQVYKSGSESPCIYEEE
ncbi:hypothetical protein TNCV_4794291 [Trichonephila clavipes]|nr:hypothetical protein TNCV_4794291 [Trichonephila clavipes]